MDKKQLQHILDDLYAIDPGLKEYGPSLEKTIAALLVSRPDTQFDEEFAKRLRNELMTQAESQSNEKPSQTSFLSIMKLQKYWYVGVAVLALVIAIPTLFLTQNHSALPTNQLANGSSITQRQAGAFGALSLNGSAKGSAAVPLERAEEAASSVVSTPGFGGGGGGIPAEGDFAIYPTPWTIFTFQYEGEAIELTDEQLPVLRRIFGNIPRGSYADLINSLGLGIADLSKLRNPELLNLMVRDDSGFSVSIDLQNGSINMFRNEFRAEPYQQLSINDVPSDERIIALADSFLRNQGISTAGYGSPIVQNDWRIWYEQADNKSDVYIPEVMTVIYPLIIEGNEVYDQGGNPDGLMVNVDIRGNQVNGAHNISTQNYESSLYTVATNLQTVIDAQNNQMYVPEGIQVDEKIVALGTPEFVLEKIYQHNPDNGQTDQLYVPALRFPVTEKPSDNPWYPNFVVMPLVTDLINNQGGVLEIAR